MQKSEFIKHYESLKSNPKYLPLRATAFVDENGDCDWVPRGQERYIRAAIETFEITVYTLNPQNIVVENQRMPARDHGDSPLIR